ncbi:NAD(P)-dependent oxidoreductase [Claveliimonas bilis]|uniref:sugar nucleotide-binding protein n=1 Tax=Claveliimonas bilis TaxID=3028070 RepID=UPI002930C78D|nr:sugar nucleotide-binding protein [Claveliimonas bilis]BDZ84425.1 NAD(P)-dependent oxidoreductase [Claveliimonas bilis]
MKFLVMGCNGMAGHMISLYLKEQGHKVTGYARQKSRYVDTVIGDASDFELVKTTVLNGSYDSVINCIGLLNQFAENNHADAVLLNGYFPHYLAKITANTDTQIIHMSTDCVFSGKTGGYTEESVPDGVLFYDKSKAIGELEDEKNITLRNSIVGPDIKESGIGLLNWFMKQSGPVNGFTGAIWTGQTTLQLAKTMEQAAKLRAHGLYNTVPDKTINKYELLQLFNTYIRRVPIEIDPLDKFVTDKSLVRTRYDGFDYKIPDYKTMILELGEWMREHKELYPHYEI